MKKITKKKIMMYGFIALLIVIIIAVAIRFLNPLRKSENEIKESIIKLIPIGMSMEDTIKVIENKKKWETRYISYDYGYDTPGSGAVVGEKSIRIFIGEYKDFIFFTTSVTILFGFDEESKLIEVYVWKDIDSL